MKHLGTKTLETDRLILRQFSIKDDSAMYHNWASDPDVTKFLMWTHHETIAITRAVLKDWENQYYKDDYYQWTIVLKEKQEPIGGISVTHKNDTIEMVHIGYCIGKKWWKQGITSEALDAIIKFFFEEVGINRIESRHDPRNPNSGKVMKKCGLKYEGTLREADWNNQGRSDSVMYAILAKDYKSTNK